MLGFWKRFWLCKNDSNELWKILRQTDVLGLDFIGYITNVIFRSTI